MTEHYSYIDKVLFALVRAFWMALDKTDNTLHAEIVAHGMVAMADKIRNTDSGECPDNPDCLLLGDTFRYFRNFVTSTNQLRIGTVIILAFQQITPENALAYCRNLDFRNTQHVDIVVYRHELERILTELGVTPTEQTIVEGTSSVPAKPCYAQ